MSKEHQHKGSGTYACKSPVCNRRQIKMHVLNRVSLSKYVMLAELPWAPREAGNTDSMSGLEFRCFAVFTHAAVEAGWCGRTTQFHIFFPPQKKTSPQNFILFFYLLYIHWPGSKSLNPALTPSRTWWRNCYKNPGSSWKQTLLLNFTHSAEGRNSWGMLLFSPSHSILRGPWRGHLQAQGSARPLLCTIHPLTGSSTHMGVRVRLKCTAQLSTSGGNSLTTEGRASLSCDSTGLWLGSYSFLILVNICWHLLYNQRDRFFTRSHFTFPS